MDLDRNEILELVTKNDGKVQLRFTKAELIIFNNALNEICNGIEVPEFETRIGASIEQVRILLASVGNVLDSLPK